MKEKYLSKSSSGNPKGKAANRIVFIDEIRGLTLILMVFYHACYLADSVFGLPRAHELLSALKPLQIFIGISFIFIAGISCSFSHSNFKRGLRVTAIALGLTAVTVFILPLIGMENEQIYFGVLHLLGICMLLYACFDAVFKEDKIKPPFLILFSILLLSCYILTLGISDGYLGIAPFTLKLPEKLYCTNITAPLGFYTKSFHSADYYPILPHGLLFFSGVFTGKLIKKINVANWASKSHIRPLAFLGRHTLIIYIVHQPVLFVLIKLAIIILN